MTYDELLDKIYWHWRKDPRGDGLQAMTDYRRTILAVVELHKPNGFVCAANCIEVDDDEYAWKNTAYPCPTIEAIEKELS